MATIVANTTINHHKGHLLSQLASGGATPIDLPRSGDGNDRCKHNNQPSRMPSTVDKPTEERAVAMATIVANTTINHHEGHQLSW
jgi:hypothetical protein